MNFHEQISQSLHEMDAAQQKIKEAKETYDVISKEIEVEDEDITALISILHYIRPSRFR